MKESWKDYLVFSKKERTGIYLLLIILGVICILPRFFCTPELSVDADAAKKIQDELLALQYEARSFKNNAEQDIAGDEFRRKAEVDGDDKMSSEPDAGTLVLSSTDHGNNGTETNDPASLFKFDPNTLAFSGWKQLGIPEKIVRTIVNYLSKGGRFRRPEDIAKIYGMHASDAHRLMPYIQIKSPNEAVSGREQNKLFPAATNYPRRKQYIVTDINTADTADWAKLPGIGSRLAFRIVQFREKLGGFHSIEQVAETWALPDSTFQKIKPWLSTSTIHLRTIRINEADQETLRQHPYLRWELARAIVDFRKQHGPFKSEDDLKKIILLPGFLITKIAPYIEYSIP